MSEWWTYSVFDFLLFSPTTWHRLFERYNQAVWPWHLIPLAVGLALLVAILRGKTLPVRLVAGFLAACWAWVGWAFHLERYATINWAATHFGAAFIAEAILLAVLAAFARGERLVAARRDVAFRTGAGMLLTALAYPAIGWAAGRDLVQSQAFGMAPDPTAIGTLGLLCCLRRPSRWLLGVIPVLWCLVNGAMLWAMDAPEAWLLLAAPALVAVEVARTTARRRQASAAGGSEPSG